MKTWILLLLVIVLVGAGWWYFSGSGDESGTSYRFVTIEAGDLESVVSTTGILSAVTTVQVGTQVSGRIDEIMVDFNDKVRAGQVVATIDKTLLLSAVADAKANLERNEAQLAQAQREFERVQPLFEKQFITEVEFNQAKFDLDVAQATVKSARVSLDRAQKNLQYATIRAPISGTVIERNVDVGQTVAASFSAPQLFLIANDLAEMQIEASVDESDIGQIKQGQQVRFTVQAYPDDNFTGVVRQVRLQSTIVENVVNYTAVVDVRNDDGRLLPGMTATVDFLIEQVSDVLKVANAALRFRPPQEMIAAFRERRRQQIENMPDSVRQRFAGRRGGGGQPGAGAQGGQASFAGGNGQGGFAGFGGQGRGRPNATQIWYLDEEGNLAASRVRTGISDGQMTEIRGRNIEAGMEIIAGVTLAAESSGSTNPFQSNQQGGRRRPGSF